VSVHFIAQVIARHRANKSFLSLLIANLEIPHRRHESLSELSLNRLLEDDTLGSGTDLPSVLESTDNRGSYCTFEIRVSQNDERI
jgi:hypothetical protein